MAITQPAAGHSADRTRRSACRLRYTRHRSHGSLRGNGRDIPVWLAFPHVVVDSRPPEQSVRRAVHRVRLVRFLCRAAIRWRVARSLATFARNRRTDHRSAPGSRSLISFCACSSFSNNSCWHFSLIRCRRRSIVRSEQPKRWASSAFE